MTFLRRPKDVLKTSVSAGNEKKCNTIITSFAYSHLKETFLRRPKDVLKTSVFAGNEKKCNTIITSFAYSHLKETNNYLLPLYIIQNMNNMPSNRKIILEFFATKKIVLLFQVVSI